MARKHPTLKQKRFADNLIRTGNITQSALSVYDTKSRKAAYQIGYRNLQNPTVKSYMAFQMKEMGLDDSYLHASLKRIIDSGTSKRVLKRATPSDALRGLEMAHKLRDDFPTEKKEIVKKEYRMELGKKTTAELIGLLKVRQKEAKKWEKLLSQSSRQ